MSNRLLAVLKVSRSWLAPPVRTLAGVLVGNMHRRWSEIPTVREWPTSPTVPSVYPARCSLASGNQPLAVVLSPGPSRRNHLTLGLPATATIIVFMQSGDRVPSC